MQIPFNVKDQDIKDPSDIIFSCLGQDCKKIGSNHFKLHPIISHFPIERFGKRQTFYFNIAHINIYNSIAEL